MFQLNAIFWNMKPKNQVQIVEKLYTMPILIIVRSSAPVYTIEVKDDTSDLCFEFQSLLQEIKANQFLNLDINEFCSKNFKISFFSWFLLPKYIQILYLQVTEFKSKKFNSLFQVFRNQKNQIFFEKCIDVRFEIELP